MKTTPLDSRERLKVGQELYIFNTGRLPLWRRFRLLRAIARWYNPEPLPHVYGPAHKASVVSDVNYATRTVTYGDQWVRP